MDFSWIGDASNLLTSLLGTATNAIGNAVSARNAKNTFWESADSTQKSQWMNLMYDNAFSGLYGYNYKDYVLAFLKEITKRANSEYTVTSIDRFFQDNRAYYHQYQIRESEYLENVDELIKQNRNKKIITGTVIGLIVFLIIVIIVLKKKKTK